MPVSHRRAEARLVLPPGLAPLASVRSGRALALLRFGRHFVRDLLNRDFEPFEGSNDVLWHFADNFRIGHKLTQGL